MQRQLRILDGGIILDDLGGPNIITRVLINGKGKQASQRWKDVRKMSWLWRWKEPKNQGIGLPLEAQKKTVFKAPEGMKFCYTLSFNLVRPILEVWSPEL